MPGTNTKFGSKTAFETQVRKRVKGTLAKIVAADSIQWEIADDTFWMLTSGEGYTLERIREIYTGEFEKLLGVKRELMDEEQHRKFKNYCVKIYDAIGLAFDLNRKGTYDQERKSGKAFYRIHLALSKQKATKPKSIKENMSKEQLENEANDGVVNAAEIADYTVEPIKSNTNSGDGEKSKSYVKSFDLDRDIRVHLREMIMKEPGTFYRMVIALSVHSNHRLLSEDWVDLANKELKKLKLV